MYMFARECDMDAHMWDQDACLTAPVLQSDLGSAEASSLYSAVESTHVCCGSLKASTRSTDFSLQCWGSNLGHSQAKQALFFQATSLALGLMTVQAGLQLSINWPQSLPTAGIIGTYNGACPAHMTSSRASRNINMVEMPLTSSPPSPPQPPSNTKCVNSVPTTVEGTDPGFL